MDLLVALIAFYLILCGIFIWTYFNPKESLLIGKRKIFKEEPEITESAIRNAKVQSIFGIIAITILMILLIFYYISYY